MSSRRLERIKETIKAEICRILSSELKDPRIGFATVTDVEVTPDLKYAKVFVSVYGNEKAKQQTMEGLNSALGFVRLQLGRSIRLRYTPEISFQLDSSLEHGAHIFQLLKEIKEKEP